MFLTIIAILYISAICFLTGSCLFPKQAKTGEIFVTCFTGMAFYGIVFTAISVFFPVGTITMQVLLVLGCGALCIWRKRFLALPRLTSFHPLVAGCAIAGILLLLLLNASPINHPDTLVYHAQNIRWAAEYKAIPGIANLEYHLGLQSSQFILSALFSFRFTGSNALGFANISVLCWLLLFILGKLNTFLRDGSRLRGDSRIRIAAIIPWVLLLLLYIWSFKMARLSASSGSVDFITAVFCWVCLYLVSRADINGPVSLAQLALLVCFTISIKFSAVPLLPALFFYTWKSQLPTRLKWGLLPLVLLLLLPILVRNSISSGYPLFPSGVVAIPSGWKIPAETVSLNEDYIKAYARLGVEFERTAIETTAAAPASDWIPPWWLRLALADKTLLLLTVLLVIAALPGIRKKSTWPVRLVFATSLAGTLAWFILAPDPRFGYGFIVPLAGASMQLLAGRKRRTANAILPLACSVLVLAVFSGFLIYRFINYPVKGWWWSPAGIPVESMQVIECNGTKFYSPSTGFCADAPLPCVHVCPPAVKRGPAIVDGFNPQ